MRAQQEYAVGHPLDGALQAEDHTRGEVHNAESQGVVELRQVHNHGDTLANCHANLLSVVKRVRRDRGNLGRRRCSGLIIHIRLLLRTYRWKGGLSLRVGSSEVRLLVIGVILLLLLLWLVICLAHIGEAHHRECFLKTAHVLTSVHHSAQEWRDVDITRGVSSWLSVLCWHLHRRRSRLITCLLGRSRRSRSAR